MPVQDTARLQGMLAQADPQQLAALLADPTAADLHNFVAAEMSRRQAQQAWVPLGQEFASAESPPPAPAPTTATPGLRDRVTEALGNSSSVWPEQPWLNLNFLNAPQGESGLRNRRVEEKANARSVPSTGTVQDFVTRRQALTKAAAGQRAAPVPAAAPSTPTEPRPISSAALNRPPASTALPRPMRPGQPLQESPEPASPEVPAGSSPRLGDVIRPQLEARPPATPQEYQQRVQGWRAYLAQPQVQAGLMQMAIALAQPMPQGQSLFGGVMSAAGEGFEAAGRVQTLQQEREAAQAAEARADEELRLRQSGIDVQKERNRLAGRELDQGRDEFREEMDLKLRELLATLDEGDKNREVELQIANIKAGNKNGDPWGEVKAEAVLGAVQGVFDSAELGGNAVTAEAISNAIIEASIGVDVARAGLEEKPPGEELPLSADQIAEIQRQWPNLTAEDKAKLYREYPELRDYVKLEPETQTRVDTLLRKKSQSSDLFGAGLGS